MLRLLRREPSYDGRRLSERLAEAAAMAAELAASGQAPLALLLADAADRAGSARARYAENLRQLGDEVRDAELALARDAAPGMASGHRSELPTSAGRLAEATHALGRAMDAARVALGKESYRGYDVEVKRTLVDPRGRTIDVAVLKSVRGKPLFEPEAGAVAAFWRDAGEMLEPLMLHDSHGQGGGPRWFPWPERAWRDGGAVRPEDVVTAEEAVEAMAGIVASAPG